MNKEIEVYNFFNEFLDNIKTRKIILNLVLWFNDNISSNCVGKYYKPNYVAHQYDLLSNYMINANSDYWILNNIDLKNNILQQLNIFSKDEYYNVFEFFKYMMLEHFEPINKSVVEELVLYDYSNYKMSKSIIASNDNFVKKMYVVSLNNILEKYYDAVIDKSKKDKNFIIEENYNSLVKNKIKNIFIEKLPLPKINNSRLSFVKTERDMYEHEKKEYIDNLFKNTNQYYYKNFNFSFDNLNVDNWEFYAELFNIILNEYNTNNLINIDNEQNKDNCVNDIKITHKSKTGGKKEITTKTIEKSKEKKQKKKTIPPQLKIKVWNKHIGDEIGKTKCLCCKLQDIYQASFSCGHIVSEINGGELKLNNLKPICSSCNSSMGSKNMNEYIKEYGF